MKIAAFDSGMGGLTAIAPLLKAHENLKVSYLGDLANLPYGSKSPTRIRELTHKNITWLLEKCGRPDLVLIACNTASAQALDVAQKLCDKYRLPLLGVLEAGCKQALLQKPKRVVVLATSATVRSQAYSQTLKGLGFKGSVVEKACPLFVPLVEDKVLEGPALEWTAKKYLEGFLQEGDQVILGCTHYPFLKKSLSKIFPNCSWIEAGEALLHQENVFLKIALNSKAKEEKKERLEIFISDPSANLETCQFFIEELGLSGLSSSPEIVRVEL